MELSMRQASQHQYFDTKIVFTVLVPGSKFRVPGKDYQFNPYLENQSLYLTRALIKKLGACKQAEIEYHRDTANNIQSFEIVLELLTESKLEQDIQTEKIVMNAFTSSMKELNPEVKSQLFLLPYKCQMIKITSCLHQGQLPILLAQGKLLKSDNEGILYKVSFQFSLAPSEENPKNFGARGADRVFDSKKLAKEEKHAELMRRLEGFRNPNNELFFQSLEKKNYAQALRRACNSSDESAVLVKILLEYTVPLKIKIDEQAGEKQYSALHYAAFKGNRALYNLLVSHHANEVLLDATLTTPYQYALETGIVERPLILFPQ